MVARYRPTSVRELLREIKDLSEFMVDLAYSSVLFDSEELAKEVLVLEENIAKLRHELCMHTILAGDTPEDAEALAAILEVSEAASEIARSASDIAKIVLRDFHLHPIVIEALQQAEERIVAIEVREGSEMVGKTLGDLDLPTRFGAVVLAIRRELRWILWPEDSEVISKGDVLVVRVTETGADSLREYAGAVE